MNYKHTKKTVLTDGDLAEWYKQKPRLSLRNWAKHQFIKAMHYWSEVICKSMGIFKKGYKNAMDTQVLEETLHFSNLPIEFDGLSILFLSDLHIGSIKELPEILQKLLPTINADLCLLGGDYRYCFAYPTRPFLKDLGGVISSIKAPMGIYGVLGNHDDLELIPALENLGIQMLTNENIELRRGNQKIFLVGLDEPVVFRRHDPKKAFKNVPTNVFSLCLTHGPDIFDEVAEFGADLYLCGHTHQGQICLPKLGPIVTLSRAPRSYASGFWKHKDMIGFTGPGLGAGPPRVRFLCPPQIVVLTLKSGKIT